MGRTPEVPQAMHRVLQGHFSPDSLCNVLFCSILLSYIMFLFGAFDATQRKPDTTKCYIIMMENFIVNLIVVLLIQCYNTKVQRPGEVLPLQIANI